MLQCCQRSQSYWHNFLWRSEEHQRVHLLSALVAEVEDIDMNYDVDDDEEGMQVELV